MLLSLLFFSHNVYAVPGWQSWANGSFIPKESMHVIHQRREQAKAETLDASNFLVRNLATSKLDEKPYICAQYDFEAKGTVLKVTCDDRGSISINLNGEPTEYKKPDGTTLNVVAKVDGSQVTQTFVGESGGLKVVYLFSQEGVLVTKSISSSYLGKALTVDVFYRLKELE
ncbi:MAG: hypothetical protein CMK59_12475 [Proteobacteria bacterium]|nr:hypothetical protein [Pseudomonadota bacterium]